MSTLANLVADPTTSKPPRPRRWIPLSLRMFVAVLALLGLGSSLWIGVPAYRQRMAIWEIERLGGKVFTQPSGPNWLREIINETEMRAFDTVDAVSCQGVFLTDAAMSNLAAMPGIKELYLARKDFPVMFQHFGAVNPFDPPGVTRYYRSPISDAGLVHLAQLRDLQVLDLGRTRVTDIGLAQLERLTNLERLDLQSTSITDAGLSHLKRLTKLKFINLQNNNLSDRGLADLSGLVRLEELGLSGTHASDAGLPMLKGLTKLKHLDLGNTAVSGGAIDTFFSDWECNTVPFKFRVYGNDGIHSVGEFRGSTSHPLPN